MRLLIIILSPSISKKKSLYQRSDDLKSDVKHQWLEWETMRYENILRVSSRKLSSQLFLILGTVRFENNIENRWINVQWYKPGVGKVTRCYLSEGPVSFGIYWSRQIFTSSQPILDITKKQIKTKKNKKNPLLYISQVQNTTISHL